MSDTWGKGSVNNNIGWGQAAGSATNNWGESQKTSWAGQTDIVGITSVSIAYTSSAFCADASDPTPTISNNAGVGTFSSTAGLVFISTTTGEVDLDASTAGATYVITYTDTDAATATFSLTINDLDNAGFSYSASSYEPTDADPTPTITGLTGGTFSGTTGLVINSTTGEIDLSASTIATHTITYNTTSSGSSVCPNTSTQTVEIALAGIANNYSMNFDSASSDYISIPDISLSGEFTLSFWMKPNLYAAVIIGDDASQDWFRIHTSTQTDLKLANSKSSWTSGVTFTTGEWQHVVLRRDSSNVCTIFRNGVHYTNNSPTKSGTFGPLNKIGQKQNVNYFDGQLDELAIWNTALTSTQVSEIYNATSTNLTKDLTTVSGSNLIYWNRMGD